MQKFLNRLNLGKIFQYYLSVVLMIDGTDKFFNLVTYWPNYLAYVVPNTLHVDPVVFLYALGVIEFAIGVVMWFSARWGGLLVAALMVGISVNLLIAGVYLNIVFIDIGLAIAALALSQSANPNAVNSKNQTS